MPRLALADPLTLALALSLAACATTPPPDAGPPAADRGLAPASVRGFGSPSGPFSVYVASPDALLVLELEPPAGAPGVVRLDVAAGLPAVRRAELAVGAGRDALLPSGPAQLVPSTVVRARATAGAVFVERLAEGGLRVSARGLAFDGGRSIDLAPRPVKLGTYPP